MRNLKLFIAAFFLFVCAGATHAEPVSLTAGTLTYSGSFVTISVSRAPVFTLTYSGDSIDLPGDGRDFQINTRNLGFGFVTLNDVTTNSFRGSGFYTNDTLTGTLIAYASGDTFQTGTPIFDVTLAASGFVVNTPGTQTFVVAVPEPTSILLLGSGLATVILRSRRKRASYV